MRTTRIFDVLSRPEVVIALLELARREASQQELLGVVKASGAGHIDQGTMSRHLGRLENLGLVEKPGKRGPYHLRFPQETLALITAALALSETVGSEEGKLDRKIGDLLRRTRLVGLARVEEEGA